MMSQPEKNHEWLKRFVGEWEFTAECSMGPNKPSETTKGSEKARMFGELWVIGEMTSGMPGGGEMKSIITLGYDPLKGKFVGTWVGAMMTQLFVYEGELDEATQTLPLNTVGPSWTDPKKTAHYQDVVQFLDSDRRLFWSQVRGDDGQWFRFMTAEYRRIK